MRKKTAIRLILLGLLCLAPPVGAQPPPAPSPRPALGGTGSDQDAVNELMRAQQEAQKAYDSLNALNPMSDDYGKAAPSGQGAPKGPLADLQKLLSNPAVQAYLRFFNNPAFAKGIEQVLQHPSRMTVLYAELGWLLLIFVIRAWRFSKAGHWARKLWVQAYTIALFWAVAVIAIPSAVIGESYVQTVQGAIQVLLKK